MEKISDTQKKIYEFLVERSQGGVPPSIREIGAAVGLKSTSSVHANLEALEKAGYILRDPLLKRSKIASFALWHIPKSSAFTKRYFPIKKPPILYIFHITIKLMKFQLWWVAVGEFE